MKDPAYKGLERLELAISYLREVHYKLNHSRPWACQQIRLAINEIEALLEECKRAEEDDKKKI